MPKGVFFNNVKYLSSKEAGFYASYTHDYVSRLCREGKVLGMKVGKAWFVESESFQMFLSEQEDKKNNNQQTLSKDRKKVYKNTVEEREIQEITHLGLPDIKFPKYLTQEIFAVTISVALVFGTYLIKDSSYTHLAYKTTQSNVVTQVASIDENINRFKNGIRDGLDSTSEKMIASVFEITSKDFRNYLINSYKESFTFDNFSQGTLNVISKTGQTINHGLSSYHSLINKTGDRAVLSAYGILNAKDQFSVEGIKTKSITFYKETVSGTLSGISNTKSTVTSIPNNLATIDFSSVSDLFKSIAQNIRIRTVAWLGLGSEPDQNEINIVSYGGGVTVSPPVVESTIINQPVIERIIETKEIIVKSGITERDVEIKLEQLNNKLTSEIYQLSSVNAGNIINNYNTISQTNKIDKLGNVVISNSTFTDGTISGSTSFSGTTGSFNGSLSAASFTVGGDTSIGGGLTIDTSGLVYDSSTGNVGIGTSTPYAKLSVVGPVAAEYFHATSSSATSTFAGGLLVTRAPTTAHTFAPWAIGTANSELFDASLVVNPASAVADSNLISAAVNGSVVFLIDAEGDAFVNNLTSIGDVTLAETSASTFTVEGNTTLGDSISDTTTINGTLVVTGATSVSTVAGNFGVGTTSPWGRLSVSGVAGASTPLFTISTTTSGNATSTAIFVDENGKFGIGTTSPSAQLSVSGNGLFSGTITTNNLVASNISTLNSLSLSGLATFANGFISQASSTISAGGLTTVGYSTTTQALVVQGASATSTFAGGLAVETSGLVYDYFTGNVGIGTASPNTSLHIAPSSGDAIINLDSSTARIQYSGANVLSFNSGVTTIGVAGSEKIRIQSDGNVGIGTTSPYAKLSVVGEVVASHFTGTSTTATSTFAGFLGVGTTNPQGRLAVSSANQSLTWTQIGSSLGISFINGSGIAALSPNLIAHIDPSEGDLRTYKFDGSTWSQIGSDLNISGFSQTPSISALSPNRIAYLDPNNDDLRVYEFDGNTWTQIGSDLNISGTGNPIGLTTLSPNRIAYIDTSQKDLRVFEFNGSTWSQIGTDFNITSGSFPTITALSPNRIAYLDSSNDDLRVYEFDGNTWTQIGSDLNIADSGQHITTLSQNRIAYIGSDTDDLRVYEFNGSTWAQIGSDLNVPVSNNFITALSPNRIALTDSVTNELRTYQFSSPTFFVGDSEDFPYLSVSDSGYTTAEALSVRTGLRVGQSATSTAALSTPALIITGESTFSSRVGIGTTSPYAQLSIVGQSGNDAFVINDTSGNTDFIIDSTGNVGIGTTSPYAKLSVVGEVVGEYFTATSTTATSTFAGGLAVNTSGLIYDYSTNNVGIGTSDPSFRLQIIDSTSPQIVIQSNETDATTKLGSIAGGHYTNAEEPVGLIYYSSDASNNIVSIGGGVAQVNAAKILKFYTAEDQITTTGSERLRVTSVGDVGIGVIDPDRRLEVFETVSAAQLKVSYDATTYADFQVDSVGDLIITPSGGDIRANDENLYVCSGGACTAGTPAGTGNIIAETAIGIGTSTPTDQLSVANNIFIGGGGAPTLGTATSTFEGDIIILGKLDVGTIDPVYTIDGTKYATYGHSTVGIKEETVFSINTSVFNKETEEYEHEINFDELEEGSDLWLFYQVTSLGEKWEDLVVTLTPGFKGAVHYEKFAPEGKLLIASSQAGEISVRLIANRFDGDQWPNLRPDQDSGWKGFVLKAKDTIFGN